LSLQDRKANLEKQVIEAENMGPEVSGAEGDRGSSAQRIQARKAALEALLIRYSEKHPDVIRLKQEIQSLEGEPAKDGTDGDAAKKDVPLTSASLGTPLRAALLKQVADVSGQIAALQARSETLRREIATYQERIDNTPLRGIEPSKISRTYSITLAKYQDLLKKGLESEISENMERREKGEQFYVVDPATFPNKPIRPNRNFIMLMGLFAGLATGAGLAFAWEVLDSSFKGSDELNGYVNLPVLATIPRLTTRGSILEQRRAQVWLLLSSAGTLAVGLILIRFFGWMLI
jgi:uncharacterized protein involved in exopolysaccharide biosynthesis